MPSLLVPATDQASDRARNAARARWGEPRVIRLDSLTPEQRHLVLALVEAAKKATPADASAGAASEAEGHRNGTPIAG